MKYGTRQVEDRAKARCHPCFQNVFHGVGNGVGVVRRLWRIGELLAQGRKDAARDVRGRRSAVMLDKCCYSRCPQYGIYGGQARAYAFVG